MKDPDAPKSEWEKNLHSIDVVAQWLAYTIATPPYNGEPVPHEDKTPAYIDRSMTALMQEVEFFTNLSPPASNMGKLTVEQVEFGDIFGQASPRRPRSSSTIHRARSRGLTLSG